MFNILTFSHFFSNVQETQWYAEFLKSVLNEVKEGSSLLDVGTGSGKLLEMLKQHKEVSATGIDTSRSMLDEASQKLNDLNIKLQKIEPGQSLPFKHGSFENISYCNVLFNLSIDKVNFLLNEGIRISRNMGKLLVLTPTGKGNVTKQINGLPWFDKISFLIWFNATRNRAKNWNRMNYLAKYCKEQNLTYEKITVFNGFAFLEIMA